MLLTQPGLTPFFIIFFFAYALGWNYLNEEYFDVYSQKKTQDCRKQSALTISHLAVTFCCVALLTFFILNQQHYTLKKVGNEKKNNNNKKNK